MPKGLASSSEDTGDGSTRSSVRFGSDTKDIGGTGDKNRRKSRIVAKMDHDKVEALNNLSAKGEFDMEELYAAMEPKGKNPFKKAIMGDIFGSNEEMNKNSLLGMMYNSRIQDSELEHLKRIGTDGGGQLNDTLKQKKGANVEESASIFEDGSDEDEEVMDVLNSKQQLALTIRNWSVMPENDDHLIGEGAVHALIALAGTDDNFIKKCCATALCNLSSREANRQKLLDIGSANGVIQIAMGTRNWKIAKLCAYTLTSLSMHEGGEAVMAGEGAILALVVLLGLKGYRLLPLAAQSLYNLTCIENHYKGVERTIKAFLSLPPTQVDTSAWLLKSLVNCCRYSWIRMRIIEDGALSGIQSLVSSLEGRANKVELVPLIADTMRLLSESPGCRIEIIQKGGIEIIEGILPYTDEPTLAVAVKALHNVMKYPTLSDSAFSKCGEISVQVVRISDNSIVREYASACLYKLAQQNMRGMTALADQSMAILPKLIAEENPLTQFFAIATAGDLFFLKGTDPHYLKILIEGVVAKGSVLTDEDAIEGLLVALAKLSQDEFSMSILEQNNLYPGMLNLLLNLQKKVDTYLANKTVGIAVCRISLRMDKEALEQDARKRIAGALINILDKASDVQVQGNTIAAIRALNDAGICQNEFLSATFEQGTLFSRLAGIVKEHGPNNQTLSRNCCAMLAGISYMVDSHDGLSKEDVVETLFLTTLSDDNITRELSAITMCNMTTTLSAAERLIKSGVCGVVATLSGATSERMQELCAKCICNLTCVRHLHQEIISHGILQTILLIALVRTVMDKTKLICARAVMNLMSDDTIESLKTAGAIRVFAAIAAVQDTYINDQCAQGFLVFTTTPQRREDICARNSVLKALFLMVKSPSAQCRQVVGRTVCNLLSCARSQKASIAAGALHVVKIISTMDYPVLREAAARVVMNLMQQESLHPLLLDKAPIVPILSFIMNASDDETNDNDDHARYIFDCAVVAMSCVSQSQDFRMTIVEEGGVAALVKAVMDGKILNADIAAEVVRTFTLLSYEQDAIIPLTDSHVFLVLHIMYRKGLLTPHTGEMIGILIRNLAMIPKTHTKIIESGAILLFRALCEPLIDKSVAFARSTTIIACELGNTTQLHDAIIEQGIIALVHQVVLPDVVKYKELFPVRPGSSYAALIQDPKYKSLADSKSQYSLSISQIDTRRITKALYSMSTTSSTHLAIVDAEFALIVRKLLNLGKVDYESMLFIAKCSKNLSSSKSCRQKLVDNGVVEILLEITRTSMMHAKEQDSSIEARISNPYIQGEERPPSIHEETQSACTVALGYLSEITHVVSGDVSSLLDLKSHREKMEKIAAAKEAATAEREAKAAAAVGAKSDKDADVTTTGGKLESEGGTEAAKSLSLTSLSALVEAGMAANKDRDTVSAGSASSADSRPGSRKKSLRGMIKGGLLKGKNAVILKHGHLVQDGVKIDKLQVKEVITFENEQKISKTKEKIMEMMADEDAHDMVSSRSHQHEFSMMQRNYDDYAYKIYDNSASFEMEEGGIASKVDIGLALPEISVNKGEPMTPAEEEQSERHHESLMKKEGQLAILHISEASLAKDTQIIKVSAHDANELVLHEEETDEGYISSNVGSKRNSRSATPLGPEFSQDSVDDSSSVGSYSKNKPKKGSPIRSRNKSIMKEERGKKDAVKSAKVVPKAGVAWKGMQGEQM